MSKTKEKCLSNWVVCRTIIIRVRVSVYNTSWTWNTVYEACPSFKAHRQ